MDSYRVLIEVLKWLGPRDLLSSTGEVSSRWREVSDSRELWQDLLPVAVDLGDTCPKQYYAAHFTKSVYVVSDNSLKRYYVVAKIWVEKPLSRSIETDWHAAMTLALPHTLFLLTMSRREDTFSINTHTGTVRVLGTLSPHRQGVGLISVSGVVYAFGGVDTLQANKHDLKGLLWGRIDGATVKRSYFNPCLKGEMVYLVGGSREEAQGEKYNVHTGTFSLMPLKLDLDTCAALIHNGDLILITGFEYITKKLTSKAPAATHPMPKPHLFPTFYSGFDPVVVDNKAFFLHRAQARVVEMDLTAFTWEAYPYKGEIQPRMKGRA